MKNTSSVDRIIFLGSGPSVSLPILTCSTDACSCCCNARTSRSNKNNRLNTSILIQTRTGNLLIDCGKTFYSSCLNVLVPLSIHTIDAVLISHGHADAVLGIDDLRHFTRNRTEKKPKLSVYCDEDTMKVIKSTFPYLVESGFATGSGEIAQLSFDSSMQAFHKRCIAGLEVVTLPVEHGVYADGRPYMTNAYAINNSVLFIPDVSAIPEATYTYIDNMSIDILILDCLKPNKDCISHIGWPGCQKVISRIKPQRVFLVGVDHDIEHDRFNRTLPENVELAFDGLVIPL